MEYTRESLASRLRRRFRCAASKAPPSIWAALGAVAGFFPSWPDPAFVFLFSLYAGASAVPLYEGWPPRAGFPPDNLPAVPDRSRTLWKKRARAALAFSFGLALGASARLGEAGLKPPPEIGRFGATGFAGRLAADARRTSSGNTALLVELDSLSLSLPGSRLTLSWPRSSLRLDLVIGAQDSAPGVGGLVSGQAVQAGRGTGQVRLSLIDARKALVFVPGKSFAATEPENPATRLRRALRKGLSVALRRVSGSSFPLAQALILGIKDELDGEEAAIFRDAGCAHILALSGQHLSILFSLSALVVDRVLRRPRAAGWASLVIAFGFTWMAGPGPSLLRACASTALAFVLGKADRPQSGIASLATVFCACLALRPADARSLSFALSYAAMLGLILLAPRWENILWRLPPPLAKALAPSLAALCATAPISLGAFGRLALGGILAATTSGPVILVFMWSLLASCALGAILPFLAPALGLWHQALHAVLIEIMELGASCPAIEARGASAMAIGAVVVLSACFVYAWPHVEWALGPLGRKARTRPGGRPLRAFLRFPRVHTRIPGGPGPGHGQAFRPELPRGQGRARAALQGYRSRSG
ncbi:MAG TPA: ComEC/Rec2 family competence protein [Rectinemataceae bacterium]